MNCIKAQLREIKPTQGNGVALFSHRSRCAVFTNHVFFYAFCQLKLANLQPLDQRRLMEVCYCLLSTPPEGLHRPVKNNKIQTKNISHGSLADQTSASALARRIILHKSHMKLSRDPESAAKKKIDIPLSTHHAKANSVFHHLPAAHTIGAALPTPLWSMTLCLKSYENSERPSTHREKKMSTQTQTVRSARTSLPEFNAEMIASAHQFGLLELKNHEIV